MKKTLFGMIAGATMLAAQGATAATLVTLSSNSGFSNGSWSFGEIFTVGTQDLSVTALGAYDDAGNGFVTAGGIHVGLYRESDATLLASTHVQSADTLAGNYRFSGISALTLLANTQYRVVAVSNSDNYNVSFGGETYGPDLISNGYAYCGSTTLQSCNTYTGSNNSWMANMQYNVAAVPVPAAFGLLFAAVGGLGALRRRKS